MGELGRIWFFSGKLDLFELYAKIKKKKRVTEWFNKWKNSIEELHTKV